VRRRAEQESQAQMDTNIWSTEVLPNFEDYRRHRVLKAKLTRLCWNGIPPAIRKEAWRRMVRTPLPEKILHSSLLLLPLCSGRLPKLQRR